MQNHDKFIGCFGGRFWTKLKESLVPFDDEFSRNEITRQDYLAALHTNLSKRNYYPSNPRDYICTDKHNAVTRIVPTFCRADYCVYFYCIKTIEDFICG